MKTEEIHRLAAGGRHSCRVALRLWVLTGCMAVMPEAAGAAGAVYRAVAPTASMQSTSAMYDRPAYRSTYGRTYTGSFLPQAGGTASAGAASAMRLRTSGATVRSYGSAGAGAQGFTRPAAAGTRASGSATALSAIAVGRPAVAPSAVLAAADDKDLALDDGFTKTMRRQEKPQTDGDFIGDTRDGWTWNGTEWVGGPAEVDTPLGDGLWLLLLLAGLWLFRRRKTVET